MCILGTYALASQHFPTAHAVVNYQSRVCTIKLVRPNKISYHTMKCSCYVTSSLPGWLCELLDACSIKLVLDNVKYFYLYIVYFHKMSRQCILLLTDGHFVANFLSLVVFRILKTMTVLTLLHVATLYF